MIMRSIGSVCLALAIAGCAGGGPEETSGGSGGAASSSASSGAGGEAFVPSFVNIRIHSAIIRPWDGGQNEWDGGAIDQSAIDQLAELAGKALPYGEVLGWLAGFAIGVVAAPDVYGTAQLYVGGVVDPAFDQEIPEVENTCQAEFLGQPGWDQVPVDREMRFGLKLADWDTWADDPDPIGSVVLNYDDVLKGLAAKQVVPVRTDDQDLGTILFVGLSVVPAQ